MGKALPDIFKTFARRLRELKLFQNSLTISYYVTLSFFPILIAISTIIPYFNIDLDLIASYLEGLIPEPILAYTMPVITNALNQTHAGVLSISLVLTFWSASACLKYLQEGIDKTYLIENARVYVTSRIFSVIAFVAITFVLVLFMVLFTFEEPVLMQLVNRAEITNTHINVLNLFKWLGTFAVLFVFFSVLYYIAPNIKHKFHNAMPGALFAAALVLVMVNVYTIYLRFASSSLTAYGALSAFFILLVWIRVLSFIVLLGALLNAVLYERKYGKPGIRESRFDNFIRKKTEAAKQKLLSKRNNDK